jgi:L-ascorbate metabolism protein UlaG (beta-lactamase superfamily)
MQIQYLGHSCFKLKSKLGTVIMDPYGESVGLTLSKDKADIVTVSHSHEDHNGGVSKIAGLKQDKPLLIQRAGAYENGGVSVFGVRTWHDETQGAQRGENIVFTVFVEELNICHMGDIGAVLTPEEVRDIGEVDVLLMPVGGFYTVDGFTKIMEIVNALNPSILIPMHYQTPSHDSRAFGEVKTLDWFLNAYGMSPAPVAKLDLDKNRLPEEMELVVMEKTV